MTDEVGCQMRGPRIVHGIAIKSTFLHRVGSIPRVDHGINASAQWYQNIKRAFPSVLQTIIESVETTAVLILARLIALILAFPLPFRAADTMACIILDFLELTMQWTDTIARYLRKWTFSEQPLTSEEAFLNALLSFEGEMRRTAAGGNKEIVQGYLETQMGLFDKIDDSIESLHRNWDMSAPSDDPGSESELKEKHARLFKQVQETFEEALEQRNLLTWLNGRPSPLEPVWRCLLSLAQALNPTQATLPQFSKRIYFMRVALRTTVHQIKEASKSPDTSLIDDKLKVLDQKIRIAYTWLLNRLLIGLEEVKALIEVIRLGLTWLPILIRKRFGGVRRQEGINPILTAFELDEGIELSPPGSDASSDTVVDSDGTVVEVVQLRNPPGRQQVVETEVPATAESSCCAAAVEETGAEAEDNSDQHSSSGQENPSELEVPNDENRVKSSRPARRRRKNSLK